MKKTLTLLMGMAFAAAAFADVSTTVVGGNTFGVLRVDIGDVEEAIIAVPWLEPSTGDEAIAVTNVIKTANLNAGDYLYYYDTSAKAYKVWQLDSNKMWVGATSVGSKTVSAGSNQTLARGGAILLKRPSADGTRATSVYLYGQVATTAPATVTMALGTYSAPAYTLLAPPSVETTDLNAATWANIGAADSIVLPDMTRLTYVSGTGWCKTTSTLNTETYEMTFTYDTDKAKIAAGVGVWYVSGSENATSAPTVTWRTYPIVNSSNN